ncbi:unnamed protein product [Fusarium venenatum]|uniref:Tat pathway signal sequence n=1 Tax=Fusarium venenatum TaxID=56646 RepID=A0A2L2TIT3_9HYPO|nr:uncharacterized protein FVRRES_01843 [Fusarium venenatum]KAH7005008.1 hypothetical protein EDB82DRAFT_471742 [Fusarium venenatum]CEI65331.1 unnamed protein product [Fusarium venenatum]
MIRGHTHRASSFTSISRPHLPSIDENEIALTPSPSSPSTPPAPLRIPRKSPRRALRNYGIPPPAYIPPARAYRAPPPAHYSPPSYSYGYHETKGKFIEPDITDSGSFMKRRFRGVDKRRGCCLLVIFMVGAAIVAIALGVGLSIGLDNASKDIPQESLTPEPTPKFPAGSYAFRADLQNTSTDCTSNPSTWRCYPYTQGSSATFFWIITSNDDDGSYNISSTANPFAPSFANLTLKRLDENTSQERLQFSFSMTKTDVPDDMLSSSNVAAKCMFDDTLFEATLWTQRNGDDFDDGSDGDNFVEWPGNVEIVQRKMFRGGLPECVDSQGGIVGDIKSSNGTCGQGKHERDRS